MTHYDEEIAALCRDSELVEAKINGFMVGAVVGAVLSALAIALLWG